jgi:hypothetical protein
MAVDAAVSMCVVVVAVVVVEAGDGFAVVSVSRFSNESRRSSIAFHTLSGNGPVRNSAQYCSIRSSLASTFATVLQSSFAIHAGTVPGSVCVGGGMFVAAVGSTIAFTAIGAVTPT